MKLKVSRIFASFAVLSLLSAAALGPPATASSTLILSGSTATPVPELLTDIATGQVGQTGLTGAAIGTKVVCSNGVAGQITVTVKVPGASARAAGQGSVTDEGLGNYAYFPAASETPQTGSGILYVNMSAPNCNVSDAYGQIVSVNLADGSLLGLSGIGTLANQNLIVAKTNLLGFDTSGYLNVHNKVNDDKTGYQTVNSLSKYSFNVSTQVLTLLADNGTTVLGTVTLVKDANGNITSRQ